MTDPQEDKLSMYYAVEAACEKHQAAWQSLPAFVTHHAAFTAEVSAISAAAETQQQGVTGATRDKSAARETMADRAHAIAAALGAWALTEEQNQLAAEISFTRSDFLYERDTDSERNARKVHTEATANLASLADYGIDQAKLDDLDAAITAYHTALTAPRGAITDRKAATAALREGFSKADDLLNNRLDKLVPILAPDHPGFATDYGNARIIVDTGSRSGGERGGSSEPE